MPKTTGAKYFFKDTFYEFCCLFAIFNEKAVKRLKATTFIQ